MPDKQNPVETLSGTVTIATPAANGTVEIQANGITKFIEFLTPDMEDSDSTNFMLTTASGGTLAASGTVAESTRTTMGTEVVLPGTVNVIAVGEGTQSADRDIAYDIYFVR